MHFKIVSLLKQFWPVSKHCGHDLWIIRIGNHDNYNFSPSILPIRLLRKSTFHGEGSEGPRSKNFEWKTLIAFLFVFSCAFFAERNDWTRCVSFWTYVYVVWWSMLTFIVFPWLILPIPRNKRLGAAKSTMFSIGGVTALKQHEFFKGMRCVNIYLQYVACWCITSRKLLMT